MMGYVLICLIGSVCTYDHNEGRLNMFEMDTQEECFSMLMEITSKSGLLLSINQNTGKLYLKTLCGKGTNSYF